MCVRESVFMEQNEYEVPLNRCSSLYHVESIYEDFSTYYEVLHLDVIKYTG